MDTTEYLWYTIEIKIDEYPENPREWDNMWTLVTAHRNYSGDEELPSDCNSIDEAFEMHLEWEWLTSDEVYYHKVWLYEHSWVLISTSPFSCRWDSGTWGFIYVSKKKADEELCPTDKDELEKIALEYLDNEIKTLNKYYIWDIYKYHIEHLDEHAGWYESEEEAIAEAKSIIDSEDPKGKTMKMAEDLYTRSMDQFWDNVNEQTLEDCITSDGETDESQRDMIVNIIWEKLRQY